MSSWSYSSLNASSLTFLQCLIAMSHTAESECLWPILDSLMIPSWFYSWTLWILLWVTLWYCFSFSIRYLSHPIVPSSTYFFSLFFFCSPWYSFCLTFTLTRSSLWKFTQWTRWKYIWFSVCCAWSNWYSLSHSSFSSLSPNSSHSIIDSFGSGRVNCWFHVIQIDRSGFIRRDRAFSNVVYGEWYIDCQSMVISIESNCLLCIPIFYSCW